MSRRLKIPAKTTASRRVAEPITETRRQAQRRERRDALMDAALGLFLQKGLDGATIDDIVRTARTAKGNFYRYFAGKAELVAAIMEPVAQKIRDAFAQARIALAEASPGHEASRAYERLAQSLAATLIAHTPTVRLYLQEARGPASGARAPIRELAEELLDLATEISHIAREHKLVKPFAGRLTAAVTVGAAEAIISRVLAGDDLGPIFEVPEKIVELVLEGVGTHRADRKSSGRLPTKRRQRP